MIKKIIKELEKQIAQTISETRDEDGSPTSETDEGFIQGLEHAVEIVRRLDVKDASNDPRFDEFYAEYPLKKSKAPAKKAWKKIRPDGEMFETIMTALTAQKASRQWQDKQYIPHPSTWLNQERWDDEVESSVALPSNPKYNHLA